MSKVVEVLFVAGMALGFAACAPDSPTGGMEFHVFPPKDKNPKDQLPIPKGTLITTGLGGPTFYDASGAVKLSLAGRKGISLDIESSPDLTAYVDYSDGKQVLYLHDDQGKIVRRMELPVGKFSTFRVSGRFLRACGSRDWLVMNSAGVVLLEIGQAQLSWNTDVSVHRDFVEYRTGSGALEEVHRISHSGEEASFLSQKSSQVFTTFAGDLKAVFDHGKLSFSKDGKLVFERKVKKLLDLSSSAVAYQIEEAGKTLNVVENAAGERVFSGPAAQYFAMNDSFFYASGIESDGVERLGVYLVNGRRLLTLSLDYVDASKLRHLDPAQLLTRMLNLQQNLFWYCDQMDGSVHAYNRDGIEFLVRKADEVAADSVRASANFVHFTSRDGQVRSIISTAGVDVTPDSAKNARAGNLLVRTN